MPTRSEEASTGDVTIRVEGLSKYYRIGAAAERHDTVRDALAAWLQGKRRPAPKNGHGTAASATDFWALKDVSFEVKRGEVLGLIGRNGAGKSTLLKILSRITEPTAGRITLHGRVASLLEVGTGFHPELTGRENIFLNGAILGMQRAEISRKFDEIVAFAEVDQFLDTPVKRYSSGMYVRLAFAVAAHLEPEILLVDEVLAVGDVGFQQKCLGKMNEVADAGRTVVFVSHNTNAIMRLCDRAILLGEGRVLAEGVVQDIVANYLQEMHGQSNTSIGDRVDREGNGRIRFVDYCIRNPEGERIGVVGSGDAVEIVLGYTTRNGEEGPRDLEVSLAFSDAQGRFLFVLDTVVSGSSIAEVVGDGKFVCELPRVPLSPGTYYFNVFARANGEIADWIRHAGKLQVIEGAFYPGGRMPPAGHDGMLVTHSWRLEQPQRLAG